MAVHLTSQQLKVTDPEKNFWVTASAGSGKTKVLTDRMVRLMLNGTPPHRIVCLTFTKKAAAEMMHRLKALCARWAMMTHDDLYQELRELFQEPVPASLCERARQLVDGFEASPPLISTLHGFCHYLIQKFPLEAQVSLPITIMDEHQSFHLWHTACAQVIDSIPAGSAEAEVFLALAEKNILFREELEEMYQSRSRLFLRQDELLKIMSKLLVAPEPPPMEDFSEESSSPPFTSEVPEGVSPRERAWVQDIQKVQRFTDPYIQLLMTKTGAPRKNISSHPILRQWIEQEQARVAEYCQKKLNQQQAQYNRHLIQAFSLILTQYESMKEGKLDFNDLSVNALDLLENPHTMGWVSYSLDQTFDHILVDEAQDTDPFQWSILKNLLEILVTTPKKTFFIVGDPKQSIYSFQGADVRLFHSMKESFQQWCAQQKLPFESVSLSVSFRSTPAVIDAVNQVFQNHYLTPDPFPIHQTFQKELKGRVEMAVLQEISPEELAAQWVQCIQTWVNNPFYLETQRRAVEASDIMILLPRRTSLFQAFGDHLTEAGLWKGGHLITQHPFVKDLLAIARWVLYPHDDEALWTVLTGSLLESSADVVFALARSKKRRSLWQHLCRRVEKDAALYESLKAGIPHWIQKYQHAAELLEKSSEGSLSAESFEFIQLAIFKSYLESWRAKATEGSFSFFYAVIYEQGGCARASRTLGGALEEVADTFLDLVLSCPERETLADTLSWLISKQFPAESTKGGGVKLMTIHGAKGLQAPVVILPDLPPVLARESFWEVMFKQPCSTDSQEKEREYWRLLYVAMTRAQDRLYLSSRHQKGWYEKIDSCLGGIPRRELGEFCEVLLQELPPLKVPQSAVSCSPSLSFFHSLGAVSYPPSCIQRRTNLDIPSSPPFSQTILSPSSSVRETEKSSSIDFQAFSLKGRIDQKILGRALHQLLDELALRYSQDHKLKIYDFLKYYTSETEARQWAHRLHILLTCSDLDVLWRHGKGEVEFVFREETIRIDRLLIKHPHVWIIDFKSRGYSSIDWASCPYKEQLDRYERRLQEVFIGYQIHKGILWLRSGRIQWVPGSVCFTQILTG